MQKSPPGRLLGVPELKQSLAALGGGNCLTESVLLLMIKATHWEVDGDAGGLAIAGVDGLLLRSVATDLSAS